VCSVVCVWCGACVAYACIYIKVCLCMSGSECVCLFCVSVCGVNAYVRVCVWVHTRVCVSASVCVHMHVCVCVGVCAPACVCVCGFVCLCACVCVCVCVCLC